MSEKLQLRSLVSTALSSDVRMATLEGTTNLVLPVVALKANSVIRGMNSKGYEFVPGEVLAHSVLQWNSKPVVYDHPYGGSDTANTPATWEQYRFGFIFDSRVNNAGDLQYDLWLDPGRADKIGSGAQKVIRKVNSKQLVEGSTGCYVRVEQRNGRSADGKAYEYIWREIIAADHYAFGLNGSTGACSVADGCGGPRVNSGARKINTSNRSMVYINASNRYQFKFSDLAR